MEEEKVEEPKRVTPTQARAKLLRSLIADLKTPGQESELEKLHETGANFVRAMLHDD